MDARGILLVAACFVVNGALSEDGLMLLQTTVQHVQPSPGNTTSDRFLEDKTHTLNQARSFAGGNERIHGAMVFRNSTGNCLNFLHIPKNAGGAIEAAGFSVKKAGATTDWGMYDADLGCDNSGREQKFNGHAPGDTAMSWWARRCTFMIEGTPGKCSPFHVPPAFLPKFADHYAQCDTFCVVRDPGLRMFSEFNWQFETLSGQNNLKCDDYEAWAEQQVAHGLNTNNDCHFLPQSLYVNGGKHTKAPTCNRILRFERLESDFNQLMRQYNIPIVLDNEKAVAHHGNKCGPQFYKDVPAVRKYFAADYKAFGYH